MLRFGIGALPITLACSSSTANRTFAPPVPVSVTSVNYVNVTIMDSYIIKTFFTFRYAKVTIRELELKLGIVMLFNVVQTVTRKT